MYDTPCKVTLGWLRQWTGKKRRKRTSDSLPLQSPTAHDRDFTPPPTSNLARARIAWVLGVYILQEENQGRRGDGRNQAVCGIVVEGRKGGRVIRGVEGAIGRVWSVKIP